MKKIDAEQIPQLTELDLSDSSLEDLTGLKEFVALKILKLDGNNLVNDAMLTENLPETIENLSLRNTSVESSEFMKTLPALQVLDVSNSTIKDLQNIPSKLTTLHAVDTKVAGWDFLKVLNNGALISFSYST